MQPSPAPLRIPPNPARPIKISVVKVFLQIVPNVNIDF